jgi:spore coat-associated protein N
MTTIQALAAHPRRTLATLATALAASGVAVGSGADFSSQSANPSNTFSAGTLAIDNSKGAAAIFQPSNMKPGGAPQTGTVDIQNKGSLAGAFRLTVDQLTNTDTGASNPAPFAAKVNLAIVGCGAHAGEAAPTCGDGDDAEVYSGQLAGLESADLGDYAAGEKRRYQFAASLDGSAGNEYQGDSSSARFVWDAVQK